MGRRCNCAGNCSCVFKEGRGVQLSGDGTVQSPVRIDAAAPTYLVGSATDSVQVELEGQGTINQPYRIQANEISLNREPTTYVFSTPGVYTWTKPSFGAQLRAYIVGAGAGGGGSSGAFGYDTDAALGPNTYYGLGGLAGDRQVYEALMADLPATVPLVVGAGGSGGLGEQAPLVPTPGSNGQASSFNGSQAAGGVALAVSAASVSPQSEKVGQGGHGGRRSQAGAYPPEGRNGMDGYPGQIGTGRGGIGALPGGPVAGGGGLSGPFLFRPAGGGGGGGLGSIVGSYMGGGNGGAGGPGSGGGGAGISGQSWGAVGGRGGDGIIVVLVQ